MTEAQGDAVLTALELLSAQIADCRLLLLYSVLTAAILVIVTIGWRRLP